ncbi:MAG: zinc-binding dehydrogenase [Mycobacterium sp.]|nr:zinc-binding dehydrogenase [Mycobacterium sp.]
MKAVLLNAPGDLAIGDIPDAGVRDSTDAVVRVIVAGICGTDIRAYSGRPGPVPGPACGHEFVGVVEDVGDDVVTVRRGEVVVAPFMFSDGVCVQCIRGVPTSCTAGGMWGVAAGGAQAEAVRVPFADGTLVSVPMDATDERIPAVLTLADVMATGRHAIRAAGRSVPEKVAVVGDGAVGLCAVLAARSAGAQQIVLLGRHDDRLRIGKSFGATEVVTARSAEAISQVLDATGGAGTDLVVEAVGEQDALDTAVAICADGGALSLVGGPHGGIDLTRLFLRNITVSGGLTPARRYLPELLAEVLAGRLDSSPIFEATVPLTDAAQGYQMMADRRATKVLVRL